MPVVERQVTFAARNHVLTNMNVWSPDGLWIVYDTRSDAAGAVFDGRVIERVNVVSGEVQRLYEAADGAHCGVATVNPVDGRVAFILGPERPTPDWSYAANRRQGVIVDPLRPGEAKRLDARDVTPPFTRGALRGGSHVHVFSGDGQWVSFTYQDHVLERFTRETRYQHVDLRNVGVSVPIGGPVVVPHSHPRNHDGDYFSVLVTRTTARPQPGSDEIKKAFEDAWVGTAGYRRQDGSVQRRALAFQGHVVTEAGETVAELFIADLPSDVTRPGDGPLEGTATLRPFPPAGVVQRRLTYTAARVHPGLQGPRHWPRSAPDGSRIAFLMRDGDGVVQIWTISPNGGEPARLTRNQVDVTSAFTWSPDGRSIAHATANGLCLTDAETGETRRVTHSGDAGALVRPEACVFSPSGTRVAYLRRTASPAGTFNQIFVCEWDGLDRYENRSA